MPANDRSSSSRWRRGLFAVCAWCLCAHAGASPAAAQATGGASAEALAAVQPYDLLVLRPDAVELRLVPLDLQPRAPLQRGADDELLVVRLADRPAQQYQVAWADIERVQLFEELLLSAAAEEARQDRYDSAWACLERVRASNAEFPGLAAGELSALYLEAGHWHQQGQSDRALGLLHEIHRRAADYPRLAEAYGSVVDRLVQDHLQRDNLSAVRGLLGELAERFPAHPVLQSHESLLASRAAAAVSAAEAAIAAGQLRDAWAAVREALAWRPSDEAALALHRRLAAEYPVVRVGVTLSYTADGVQSWSAERVSWLLYGRWCESLGGSPWAFAVGPGLAAWEQEAALVRLRPTPAAQEQSGELFRRLLTPPAEVRPVWQALVASCEYAGPQELLVHLRGPLEEFAPLLAVPLRAGGPAGRPLPGAYAVREAFGGDAVFRSESAAPRPPGQAAEIVELALAPAEIGRALQRGDVDLVDRVPPAELARVRALPEATLVAYARPTRLLLASAPGFADGSTALLSRLLAAAAAQARPSLTELGWGADAPRALHSCLAEPAAESPADDLSASDIARLWSLTQQQFLEEGRPPPTVRLAYAATPVAEAAAQRLGQWWAEQLPGLSVQAARLTGDGWPTAEDATWDVCCVEHRSQGVRLDAWQLFGETGLLAGAGPELRALCDDLLTAQNAAELAARAGELDRCAGRQAVLVPLLEWTDYAAVRNSLSFPPEPLVGLYQGVARWRHAAEEIP